MTYWSLLRAAASRMAPSRPDATLTGAGRAAASAFCGACVALPVAEAAPAWMAVAFGAGACIAGHEAFSRLGGRTDGTDALACSLASDW